MRELQKDAKITAKTYYPYIVIAAIFFLILFSNIDQIFPVLATVYAAANIQKILEVTLIVLTICMVVLGFIVGYRRLDKEKEYARIIGEDGGELRLECNIRTFYLKTGDIENWRAKSLQNNLKK